MPHMAATELARMATLLDEVFDLDPDLRGAWLARLEVNDPSLSASLKDLLARHAAPLHTDILEYGPDLSSLITDTGLQATQFSSGDFVGPYRLVHALGAGGMGEVWLAERSDGTLKRTVALKLPVLNVRRAILVQRFERERDIVASLVHPHIARLYDAGFSDDGQPYLALEYVVGQSITDYANEHGLGIRERIMAMQQVMDAVHYAHANLVIHRDIKPSNVLINDVGNAMLLDFGVAKLLGQDASIATESDITRIGGSAITVPYASPEQIAGEPLSIATDIWSLGVLLYELLAERRSFVGLDRHALESSVLACDPTPPSHYLDKALSRTAKGMAADVDKVVLKALSKAPGDRYPTVLAFSDDLGRCLRAEPVLARPPHVWYRAQRFFQRHFWGTILGAIAVLCVLVFSTLAVILGQQARVEASRAVAARDFLIDMFRQVDADSLQGKDITAKQLLEQGASNVLSAPNLSPLLQSEILYGIADAQANMGEYKKADLVLREVVQRYLTAGNTSKAAQALVHRASVVYLNGDVTLSEKLLTQAREMLEDAQGDVGTLVRFYQLQSSIEQSKGDLRSAQSSSLKALELAERAFDNNDLRTIQSLAAVARIEGASSNYASALQHFVQAIERAQHNSGVHPRKILWMRAERVHVQSASGGLGAAASEMSDIAEQCEKVMDLRGVTCTSLRRAEASMWLELGFTKRAMHLLPTFQSRIDRLDSPQDQIEALITACRIALLNDVADDHPKWWARLHALAASDSVEKVPARFKWSAHLIEVQRQLYRGQAHAALVRLDELESQNNSADKPSHRIRRQIRLLRGRALHQLGQHTAALASLELASDGREVSLALDHPRLLLASIHKARSLWALGQQARALDLLDHAIPILRQALGDTAPNFLKILALHEEISTTKPTTRNSNKWEVFE